MRNYMNRIGKEILLDLIFLPSAFQKWTLKEQKVENTEQWLHINITTVTYRKSDRDRKNLQCLFPK